MSSFTPINVSQLTSYSYETVEPEFSTASGQQIRTKRGRSSSLSDSSLPASKHYKAMPLLIVTTPSGESNQVIQDYHLHSIALSRTKEDARDSSRKSKKWIRKSLGPADHLPKARPFLMPPVDHYKLRKMAKWEGRHGEPAAVKAKSPKGQWAKWLVQQGQQLVTKPVFGSLQDIDDKGTVLREKRLAPPTSASFAPRLGPGSVKPPSLFPTIKMNEGWFNSSDEALVSSIARWRAPGASGNSRESSVAI